MIEIKVNGEVRDVTSELFLGLNSWQLIWGLIGIITGGGVGVISYFVFNISPSLISWIAVVIVIPFGFMGFFTWHQMTAYEIAKLFITRMLDPKVKTYHGENYEYIMHLKMEKSRNRSDKKISFKPGLKKEKRSRRWQ